MTGTVAYALSKKAINEALIGIGAIAGAPCEVKSVSKTGLTTTIELKWTDTTGADHITTFSIEDGVGVAGASIDDNGNLKLFLTDGNEINCGKVNSQFITLPIPSDKNVGSVLQYAGPTDANYVKGYFYECVLDGSAYKWTQKDVQPTRGGGGSQVTTFPTPSAEELGNIYQYIGNSTLEFKNGCFYKCVSGTTPGTYEWEPISVEDPDTYEDDPIDFNNDW